MPSIATVGYEGATVDSFLHALREEGVELVVDIRAVARSRRPGFAKTRLAENLAGAGIGYLHLKALGTPADGRAAARAGQYETLREIYSKHLATPDAQDGLEVVAQLVRSGQRLCLLCFEAKPAHCHRSLVASALKSIVTVDVHHLAPMLEPIE
jgi:uncharacterized protein (DUF488 family)